MTSLAFLFLLVGLAAAQSTSVSDTLGFGHFLGGPYYSALLNGAQHPQYHSSFNFKGYNFTNITGTDASSVNTTSSETWSLNLNFTAIQAGAQNVSNVVYSLTFPEETLPITNSSDWQLCTYLTSVDWPTSVANTQSSNDGSCGPFFGQDCYAALLQEWMSQPINSGTGCPDPPFFSQVSACKSLLGSADFSAGTSTAMNFTSPNYEYLSNGSYVDITTGKVVTNPTFTGLRSNDQYAYETVDLPNLNNDTIRTQAEKFVFTALALTPSPSYRARIGGGAYASVSNPRLFCGRVLNTSSTSSSSGMAALRGSSLAAMFAGLVVSGLLYM